MNAFLKIRPMGKSSKNWEFLSTWDKEKHSFPVQLISPTTSLIPIFKEITEERNHWRKEKGEIIEERRGEKVENVTRCSTEGLNFSELLIEKSIHCWGKDKEKVSKK